MSYVSCASNVIWHHVLLKLARKVEWGLCTTWGMLCWLYIYVYSFFRCVTYEFLFYFIILVWLLVLVNTIIFHDCYFLFFLVLQLRLIGISKFSVVTLGSFTVTYIYLSFVLEHSAHFPNMGVEWLSFPNWWNEVLWSIALWDRNSILFPKLSHHYLGLWSTSWFSFSYILQAHSCL